MKSDSKRILSIIGPGILVAATGVGAGDLLTASFAGSVLGLSIIWAVIVGAVIKFFLNEGIARWQLATGSTLLEGWFEKLGNWIRWIFIIYFIGWSFFTGGALITACGVAASSVLPFTRDLFISKILWGIIHSIAGFILVLKGGFKFFERMMAVFIGLMFVTVIFTALSIEPDWKLVFKGILLPTIPRQNIGWILGLIGGVGGTVTLLSYGYWIREEKRQGIESLKTCRSDLAVGYVMTALFGIAMVIIGSKVQISGRGTDIAISLASQLQQIMGPAGWWLFLIGFWGAVFSSLLGVWQSAPYLFADFIIQKREVNHQENQKLDYSQTSSYKWFLIAITFVPIPLLWISVKSAQLSYAILGSLFMPFLSLTLLIMNNNKNWIGPKNRNGLFTNFILVAILIFFSFIGLRKILDTFSQFFGV